MRRLELTSLSSIVIIIYLYLELNLTFKQVQARFLPERFDSNEYYSKWKSKSKQREIPNNRQDSQVVPILRPMSEILGAASDAYLPDLGFIADFGSLVTRELPASPIVRLSRDLFESEQCAQYVSCETSKFSRRHQPLRWIHNFLEDFPFKGDLAERLKIGTEDAVRLEKCGFNCNPLATLTRGLRMLNLLHEIVRVQTF